MEANKLKQLANLAKSWEQQSEIRFRNAKHEKNEMGKRLIEHGAVCYFNCAKELRNCINYTGGKNKKNAIRSIGLALNASHNCIATDNPEAKPEEQSWRINHSKELKELEYLEQVLNSK